MNVNVLPSERATLLGTIDPQAAAAGTYTSDWVSMSDVESVLAILLVGAISLNGTVDAKLQQASDSAGTGAKDLTGKSITQLTDAGTDDNKQVVLNCYADELDVANSFTHVRLSVTTATAASDVAAVLLGMDARYQPVADLASVDEVIS